MVLSKTLFCLLQDGCKLTGVYDMATSSPCGGSRRSYTEVQALLIGGIISMVAMVRLAVRTLMKSAYD